MLHDPAAKAGCNYALCVPDDPERAAGWYAKVPWGPHYALAAQYGLDQD